VPPKGTGDLFESASTRVEGGTRYVGSHARGKHGFVLSEVDPDAQQLATYMSLIRTWFDLMR